MGDVQELLELERIDRDIFRGGHAPSNLQRTFGGQVAGQALQSAIRTVSEDLTVHSLHGYFLRPGDTESDTVFLVDRIRDGRSFCTRRVTGLQNGEAIFSMSASFQTAQEGIEHSDEMADIELLPEDLPDPRVAPTPRDQHFIEEWGSLDVRIVPQERTRRLRGRPIHQQVWFKHLAPLPDDQNTHVSVLAYMSDLTLLMSARVGHPEAEARATQFASLDHAMWFLRPFRADEWLLYDQASPSAGGGRALTSGRIFTRDGTLAAVVIQEGLSRFPRR